MPIELAAFDMDGTLIDVDSSWAEVHRHFGDSNPEALQLFLTDQIDDREFIRRDVQIWWKHAPTLTVQEVDRILASVPLMPGAARLFEGLRARGIHTAIVSGGIDLLAQRLGRQLGIERVFANGLVSDASGRLTGEGVVRVPIKGKGRVLAALQQELGIPRERTASVGNSEIDVDLFRQSRLGVAFLPADEAVRAGATHVVTRRDLGELLPILLEADGCSG
ncbi:MAG: HAD-IB family phosphatase [Thermoplasmata archaeon]|nr:HAD-IB family phosphatase [Thermoplasmata archaeon]MCI4341139.1 HAD-IB family phosphatase [Thermoplasmata archaeon]